MSRLRILVLLPLCFVWLVGRAQQGGDVEAQILYAFHVEDTNQLANVAQTLRTQMQANGADTASRYHLAHAEYRLGLLAGELHAGNAKGAFAECVEELKPILAEDGNSVESLSLQSACYSSLAAYEKLQAVLLRTRAASRLQSAAKLAPRNPRVVYLMAMGDLARSKAGSEENARALGELKLAVQLFEQTSATSVEMPGWGHAEAYLDLGRQLESRGDWLGARNWIEKSLLIAPDFKAAQRQRATLAGH
jgi:hypothetical protein